MVTLHMLVGIPGSGKSTYCKEVLFKKYPEAIYVSSDKTRDANPTFTEKEIWPEIYRLAANGLNSNHDVIFDATSITPEIRAHAFQELEARGAKDFIKKAYYFKTDPNKCIERALKRNQDPNERFLPVEIIPDFNNRIKIPTIEEGFSEINIIDNNENKTI